VPPPLRASRFSLPARSHASPLPLHDALPICSSPRYPIVDRPMAECEQVLRGTVLCCPDESTVRGRNHAFKTHNALAGQRVPLPRSEEHTSELQSRENLVCRLLLEKKKHKQG